MTVLIALILEALLVVSLMAYITTIIILLKRKQKTGFVKAYLAFTMVCLYWSICEALAMLLFHVNIPLMYIIIQFKYIAAFLLGPLWLVFCLYYTDSKFIRNGLNVKKIICFLLPSFPFAILSYTNYYHNAFYYIVDGKVYYSWAFWIHIALQISYNICGCILIIQSDLKKSGRVKKRNIIIITGIILSLLIMFLYYFFRIYQRLDNTDIVPSTTLLVTASFFGIASLKFRFLNILPMAFPKIVENMNEGILIVDYEGNISFCNLALSDILEEKVKVEVGRDAIEISHFLAMNAEYDDDGKRIIEAMGKGGFSRLKGELKFHNKQFQIYYQPLFDRRELIGWIISFIDISEHKALLGQLSESNRRLSNAYTKLLEHAEVVEELAAEKERNKIATEIHDSQGHCLSLLVALLEVGNLTLSSDIKTAEDKFTTAYEVARQGLGQLRNTVSDLATVKLSGSRLIEAIQSMIEGFEAVGMDVDLTVKGLLPGNITEEIANAIYNICREALTNALKHSDASSVNVMLCINEKTINLYIFDNGKGCDSIIKGNGLKGMENRVFAINGHISFGSGGEKCFGIHVEIPM